MALYNAKKVEDVTKFQYNFHGNETVNLTGQFLQVSKFDEDLNVESTYITSTEYCSCPAGSRSTCRHRQMYPHLKAIADTNQFWEFDNQMPVVLDEHGNIVSYSEQDNV